MIHISNIWENKSHVPVTTNQLSYRYIIALIAYELTRAATSRAMRFTFGNLWWNPGVVGLWTTPSGEQLSTMLEDILSFAPVRYKHAGFESSSDFHGIPMVGGGKFYPLETWMIPSTFFIIFQQL